MFLYAIIVMLMGLGLLSSGTSLAVWLHRRFGVPYALLTVGVLTYILSFLAQYALLRTVRHPLLGVLSIRALTIGLFAGFTEEFARLLGFQYLARSTMTRSQALMIGVGHGFSGTLYTGLLAVGLGFSLLGYGTERPDDVGAVVSGALAEAFNGVLPILMHMALSWIVLQVFLRGQLFWLFVAIFMHTIAEIMAALLGPNDVWTVVLWRALIALIGVGVIIRLRSPELDAELPTG